MCLSDKGFLNKSLDYFLPVYFIIWKNKKEVIYSGQNNSDKAQLLQGMKSFMAKLMLPENDYILVGKTLLALITI